jgi:tetratricopeptide (TPR) repeat protein
MARPFREGGRSTMDFMLEVAQQTADTLAALMGIEAGTLRVPRLTTDPIADSLYAQVRYELPQNYTLPGLRRAAAQLEQAIARDSGFAPAYVLLADVLYEMSRDHWDPPPREQMGRVQELLDRALELDPTSPDLHRLLGWVAYTWDWDWAKAEDEYREAIRLGPNNAFAHGGYAFLLLATGRIEEGLEESRRSVQLDPMNPITGTTYCWHLYLVHRFDDALAECRYVIEEINPTKLVALGAQRLILAFGAPPARRPDEARAIHITDMDTRVNYEHSAAIWAAMGGDTARALTLIDADKRDPKARPFRIANAYAWAGQLDSAFVWLDRAIEARDPFIPEIAIRPVMEPYQKDPRYLEVLRRVGLPIFDLPRTIPAGEPTGADVTAGS